MVKHLHYMFRQELFAGRKPQCQSCVGKIPNGVFCDRRISEPFRACFWPEGGSCLVVPSQLHKARKCLSRFFRREQPSIAAQAVEPPAFQSTSPHAWHLAKRVNDVAYRFVGRSRAQHDRRGGCFV